MLSINLNLHSKNWEVCWDVTGQGPSGHSMCHDVSWSWSVPFAWWSGHARTCGASPGMSWPSGHAEWPDRPQADHDPRHARTLVSSCCDKFNYLEKVTAVWRWGKNRRQHGKWCNLALLNSLWLSHGQVHAVNRIGLTSCVYSWIEWSSETYRPAMMVSWRVEPASFDESGIDLKQMPEARDFVIFSHVRFSTLLDFMTFISTSNASQLTAIFSCRYGPHEKSWLQKQETPSSGQNSFSTRVLSLLMHYFFWKHSW